MSEVTVKGSCLCGGVKYEVSGETDVCGIFAGSIKVFSLVWPLQWVRYFLEYLLSSSDNGFPVQGLNSGGLKNDGSRFKVFAGTCWRSFPDG